MSNEKDATTVGRIEIESGASLCEVADSVADAALQMVRGMAGIMEVPTEMMPHFLEHTIAHIARHISEVWGQSVAVASLARTTVELTEPPGEAEHEPEPAPEGAPLH